MGGPVAWAKSVLSCQARVINYHTNSPAMVGLSTKPDHNPQIGNAPPYDKSLGATRTSFSDHKTTINVWRPGSARIRWGSLSAPPDPLAANVAASRPGGGKLLPSHCFPPLVSATNRTLHGGDPQAGSILTCLQARSCLEKF